MPLWDTSGATLRNYRDVFMCAGWLFVCRKCPDINVRRLLIRDADSSSTIRLRVSGFLQSDLR